MLTGSAVKGLRAHYDRELTVSLVDGPVIDVIINVVSLIHCAGAAFTRRLLQQLIEPANIIISVERL